MKTIAIALISSFFLAMIPAAQAAPTTRSRESCLQLANERGFTTGGRQQNYARRSFIGNCMKGRQN